MLKVISTHKVNNSDVSVLSLHNRFMIVISDKVMVTPIDKTEVLHLNDVMLVKSVLVEAGLI